MIATTVLRELAEIDSADLEAACARFIRAAHMVALENDPRTASGEASVHTGKPGSRPPGREQCAGAVKRLCKLADYAQTTALTARKEHEHRIESMGGIVIAAPNGVAVSRRETRIGAHLHGKLVEAVGGMD
jgi:hypothetical protein